MRWSRTALLVGRLTLPGALTAALAFNAGGYYAGTTALAAAAVLTILVLRLTSAREPLAGVGWMGLAAASALALFTAWTLVSAVWSDAASRALIEFDRALLYLALLVLFASFARRGAHVRWMTAGVAAAAVLVAAGGLVPRMTGAAGPIGGRLSDPLTYWNAQGLLACVGILLCLHLASSAREPRFLRVLGAAAVPLLASALLLTYSRGAIAVLALALPAYLLLVRSRGLAIGLLSTAPAAFVAVRATYQIAGEPAVGEFVAGQGPRLATWVLGACAAAAALRSAALVLEADTDRAVQAEPSARRRLAIGGLAAATVAVVAIVAVSIGLPGELERQYERFVVGDALSQDDPRARLTDPGNNGRLEQWRVAMGQYRAEPVHGVGAGTFPTAWDRERRLPLEVKDAHSLYLETMGELGLVGLALLAAAIGLLLVGALRRCRGPDRDVYAAVFAVLLAWALHAGIDWDWELPAVTAFVLCLGGAAVARSAGDAAIRGPGRVARVLGGLVCLIAAVTPVSIALSQHHLDESSRALRRGDCNEAIERAIASNAFAGSRPEPFEVLGYCDARLGATALSVRAFDRAIARDPRNWELHYGSAVVRAAGGQDPRDALRATLRLNPREEFAREARRRLDTPNPAVREERARSLPLPLR